MKLWILSFLIIACHSQKLISYMDKNEINSQIKFSITHRNDEKNVIWITVHNFSKTEKIIVSNPFNYPVTSFKVYDNYGMEFNPVKMKFSKDYSKDTIEIQPNSTITGKLNPNLEIIFPDLKSKEFNKIIAKYQYRAFANDGSMLSDTLIVR